MGPYHFKVVLLGRYGEFHLAKWGVPPGWGQDLADFEGGPGHFVWRILIP